MDDFDLPLSSPFTWKPSKIIKFWSGLHNHIKNIYENGEVRTDPGIKRFRYTLDENARNQQVFRPANNWEEALGPYQYDLVTKTEQHVQSWWPTSLVTLLRVIRNKHEHQEGLTPEEKNNLEWFRVVDEKLQFDENMFVSFWTSKFPQLMAFLWKEFTVFNELFKDFYPESLDISRLNLELTLVDFVTLLRKACLEQTDKGFLHARYKVGKADGTVEVRMMTSDLLTRVLDGSSTLTMVVSKDRLQLRWNGCEMIYKSEKRQSWNPDAFGTYVFVSGSDQIDENLILRNFKTGNDCDKNVFVFTSEDAIQSIANKFSSNAKFKKVAITWGDLSGTKREEILNGNKFLVKLGFNELPIRKLMPENEESKIAILEKLEGKVLNLFLTTQKLEIFTKQKIPKKDEFYTERRFYNRAKLNSIILNESLNNDVMVIIRNSVEKLSPHKRVNARVVSSEDVFPKLKLDDQNVRVIEVANVIPDLSNALKIFEGWESQKIKKNINFLEYIGEDTFNWVYTQSYFTDSLSKFDKAAKKVGMMSEPEFLISLDSSKTNKRLIFIADQPGMGKTQVLISLARSMIEMGKNETRVVMFFPLHDFVKTLKKVKDNKRKLDMTNDNDKTGESICENDIIAAVKSLACCNKFEEAIITYLLSSSSCNVKFELLLDGLDELNLEFKALALETLQMIKTKFQANIRVWVTLRDHLLPKIGNTFGVLGYKLDPLSRSEQKQLIMMVWRNSSEHRGKLDDFHRPDIWLLREEFAAKCAENFLSQEEASIAGVPLQCKMIADIYEDQCFQGTFKINQTRLGLISLYDKMLERKLEIYLKEKKYFHNIIIANDWNAKLQEAAIRGYLTFLSIKLVLSEDTAEKVKHLLYIPNDPEDIEILSQTVLEHGIVQSISPIKFIHRTFAEYLIAKFTCDHLHNFFRDHDDIDTLDENFQHFLWNGVLAPQYEYPQWKFQNDTLCVFLNFFLKKVNCLTYKDKMINPHAEGHTSLLNLLMKLVLYPSLKDFPHGRHFVANFSYYFEGGDRLEFDTKIDIIMLLTLSRKQLAGLFIRAVRMKHTLLIDYLIYAKNFNSNIWYELQEYDVPNKFGVLHQLFVFTELYEDDVSIRYLKFWVSYFVKQKPSLLEQKSAYGETPLLTLATNTIPFKWGGKVYLELLQVLVSELGANVNATDDKGNSVLHVGQLENSYADKNCIRGESQVLQYLQDQKFYFKLVEFLLSNGCKKEWLNSCNKKGYTPFLAFLEFHMKTYTLAVEKGWKRSSLLLRMLEDAAKVYRNFGTNFNKSDSIDGGTTLHKVIQKGYPLSIIQELIACGSNIKSKNLKGQYPIHLAVEKGDTCVVKFLLGEWPSSINVKDGKGKTILQYETTEALRICIQDTLGLNNITSQMEKKMIY